MGKFLSKFEAHQRIGNRLKKDGSLDRRFKKKVIIIGNSPSILLNEHGSLIDSYDVVIRLNKCPTKGFEKYIGSKINIWATTSNDKFYRKGHPYVPVDCDNLSYIWKRAPMTSLVNIPGDIPQMTMYKYGKFEKNKHHIPKIPNFEEYSKDFIAEPCTGLLAILTATLYFEDITILGFTFNQEQHIDYNKDQGKRDGVTVTWYYRDSEADGKNKHFEDRWTKVQRHSKFASVKQAEVKMDIIKKLIKDKKIKLLNKNELTLGDMEEWK